MSYASASKFACAKKIKSVGIRPRCVRVNHTWRSGQFCRFFFFHYVAQSSIVDFKLSPFMAAGVHLSCDDANEPYPRARSSLGPHHWGPDGETGQTGASRRRRSISMSHNFALFDLRQGREDIRLSEMLFREDKWALNDDDMGVVWCSAFVITSCAVAWRGRWMKGPAQDNLRHVQSCRQLVQRQASPSHCTSRPSRAQEMGRSAGWCLTYRAQAVFHSCSPVYVGQHRGASDTMRVEHVWLRVASQWKDRGVCIKPHIERRNLQNWRASRRSWTNRREQTIRAQWAQGPRHCVHLQQFSRLPRTMRLLSVAYSSSRASLRLPPASQAVRGTHERRCR